MQNRDISIGVFFLLHFFLDYSKKNLQKLDKKKKTDIIVVILWYFIF